MNKPEFCKDCREYNRDDRDCIMGPTKPFRRACRSFKPIKGE